MPKCDNSVCAGISLCFSFWQPLPLGSATPGLCDVRGSSENAPRDRRGGKAATFIERRSDKLAGARAGEGRVPESVQSARPSRRGPLSPTDRRRRHACAERQAGAAGSRASKRSNPMPGESRKRRSSRKRSSVTRAPAGARRSTVYSLYDIHMLRREPIEARHFATLTPKPGVKPNRRWEDHAAFQNPRLDQRIGLRARPGRNQAIDDLSFGLGLLARVQGHGRRVQRRKVNNGSGCRSRSRGRARTCC